MGRIAWVVALWMVSGLAFAQEGEERAEGAEEVSATASTEDGVHEAPARSTEHDGDGSIRDRSEHASRPLGVSGMLYIPWYHGIGIGLNARVEIPIVKDGFISSINDQVSLEPSLGLAYSSSSYAFGLLDERLKYLNITPAIYGMWSFHITPKFRPYGAIGLGYNIGMWLNDDIVGLSGKNNNFFYWDLAVGCFYNISERFSLRGELGAQGPKFGLAGFF